MCPLLLSPPGCAWVMPVGGHIQMRILGIVVLGAALSGCAGDTIKQGMNNLQGQPLSAAIAKLGMPNDERLIANQKVFTWIPALSMKVPNFNAKFASSWRVTSSAPMTSKAIMECVTATPPNCEADLDHPPPGRAFGLSNGKRSK